MEHYSVSELRDKIVEKVSSLGISEKFKDNPAFSSVLAEFDSLIGTMNIMSDSDKVMVTQEEGRISFEYTSKADGTKYSMDISCSNPDKFSCIKIVEKKPWMSNSGSMVRQKEIIEKQVVISKKGFITLTTNSSGLDDIDCQRGKCNNCVSSEQCDYTDSGVMMDREYKLYGVGPLDEDIAKAKVNSALLIAREAFGNGFWSNRYSYKDILRRDKFDTARLVIDDRSKDIFYSGVVKLSGEYGYRNMVTQGGNFVYPTDYTIEPLSLDCIDAELNKEVNPKVREALRKLADGRDTYLYSSTSDPRFECKGVHINSYNR